MSIIILTAKIWLVWALMPIVFLIGLFIVTMVGLVIQEFYKGWRRKK